MSRGGPGCLYSPSFPEGSFSEIGGSKPLDQHTTYSEQSRVTRRSCCFLPGHSHTCCEDLLRGATGCCSRVAGELVLCSALRTAWSVGYTGLCHRGQGCPVCTFSAGKCIRGKISLPV